MSGVLPSIGVVMPAFNHGEFIRDALDSILDQDYPQVHVTVVDGGSRDATIDALKAYGDRIEWTSERDKGQTDALVKGFARVKGDVLTWLNSDDIMYDRSLWRVGEAARGHPDADVYYGRGHYIDRDGGNPRPYPTVEITPEFDARTAFFEKGFVAQPSVYFRRDAFQAVGGINAARKLSMDYDLWARLAAGGTRWVFIPRDLSGNRWYEDTRTSQQHLELLAEVVAAQIENYGRVSAFFVQSISDMLYSRLHAVSFGDSEHMLVRSIYFKAFWVLLNYRTPGWALHGLLKANIRPSGALTADVLEADAFYDLLKRHLRAASAHTGV